MIFFIESRGYLRLDRLMECGEERPVESSFYMVSRMISEISCEEVVPWLEDIIGGFEWIAALESTMMMIGRIHRKNKSSDHR